MVSSTAADVVFMGSLNSDFARQASLDRSDGLAISKETSRVRLKSKTSKPILARLCDHVVRQHNLRLSSRDFVSTGSDYDGFPGPL
jgi:hypothetical protein